jgi:hypothetical protein
MKQELIDRISGILQHTRKSWPLDVDPPGDYVTPYLALALETLLLELQADAWEDGFVHGRRTLGATWNPKVADNPFRSKARTTRPYADCGRCEATWAGEGALDAAFGHAASTGHPVSAGGVSIPPGQTP